MITLREASRPVRSNKVAILCPFLSGFRSETLSWKHKGSAVKSGYFRTNSTVDEEDVIYINPKDVRHLKNKKININKKDPFTRVLQVST